jgi:hypothetical protein
MINKKGYYYLGFIFIILGLILFGIYYYDYYLKDQTCHKIDNNIKFDYSIFQSKYVEKGYISCLAWYPNEKHLLDLEQRIVKYDK